ncbi:hypothetical protein D3C80_1344710 [compost metagenome]
MLANNRDVASLSYCSKSSAEVRAARAAAFAAHHNRAVIRFNQLVIIAITTPKQARSKAHAPWLISRKTRSKHLIRKACKRLSAVRHPALAVLDCSYPRHDIKLPYVFAHLSLCLITEAELQIA